MNFFLSKSFFTAFDRKISLSDQKWTEFVWCRLRSRKSAKSCIGDDFSDSDELLSEETFAKKNRLNRSQPLKTKLPMWRKKLVAWKCFESNTLKNWSLFCTENKVLAWKAIKFQKSLSDIGTKFQNRCVLSSTDETATGVIRPRQNCWSFLQLPPKTCSKPVPKLVHDVARLKRHLVRKRHNTLQTLRALLRWLQAQPVPLPGASSPAGLSPLATLELEPRRHQLVAVTSGRRQRQRRHWHGKRPGGLT